MLPPYDAMTCVDLHMSYTAGRRLGGLGGREEGTSLRARCALVQKKHPYRQRNVLSQDVKESQLESMANRRNHAFTSAEPAGMFACLHGRGFTENHQTDESTPTVQLNLCSSEAWHFTQVVNSF